ncbi:hypothetical protein CLIB1444_09S00936 [[Candida] jaroonii]|uniref:Uncharacterized protein n=1 Tax=[Candida] jaroonii TaxID=467808 RepID=A0ACA9YCX7_9ASCO|nr:hypothetical protein CLIB1444_09S00936 [[Candida] jaroonii]
MSLNLSKDELNSVRNCWSNVQTNNKYHKDQFITRLFSNLLVSNIQLKQVLNNDLIIREHSMFFNDILNYLVIYLDNVERLNEFLNSFFKENQDIVEEISYLEPMGTALIQTFRQWLGRGLFNESQEILWVQIYIHLANNILLFKDEPSDFASDASSIEEDVEDVPALQINKNPSVESFKYSKSSSPMTPVSPIVEEQIDELQEYVGERPIDLSKQPSIQINIKSNEKYKGFRRNDSNIIDIKAPIMKPMESSPEPVITPRSPKRNSSSQVNLVLEKPQEKEPEVRSISPRLSKFNNIQPKMVYDSDEEENIKSGFDPRIKRKSRDYKPPLPPKDFVQLPKQPQSSFVEDFNIDSKPTELDLTLGAIVESDDDIDVDDLPNDNSSSIYHSDNSDPSSHDNSLSLHSYHSRGSDGTEGTEATEPMSLNLNKNELRSMSSNEFKSDVENNSRVFSNKYNSRTTSISSIEPDFKLQKSIESRQRASLGFMRSSFILKKEIETLGYNRPENVFVKPPTIPAATQSMSNLPLNSNKNLSNSTLKRDSSDEEQDQSYDMINSFMPITDVSKEKYKKFTSSCSNLSSYKSPSMKRHTRSVSNLSIARHNKYEPMEVAEVTSSLRPSNKSIGRIKTKRSFRDKVKSFFGGSSAPVEKKISAPVSTTFSTNASVPIDKVNRMASKSTINVSTVDSTRESLDRSTNLHNFDRYDKFDKRMSKMSSVSDLRSINTMDTTESTSGFSFFSRRKSIDSKYTTRGDRSKKNKYNVTSVPYDVFSKNKLVFSS